MGGAWGARGGRVLDCLATPGHHQAAVTFYDRYSGILLTGDTDLIPAMKLARGRGLQLAGLDLPNRKIIPELKPHLDFFRQLATWP